MVTEGMTEPRERHLPPRQDVGSMIRKIRNTQQAQRSYNRYMVTPCRTTRCSLAPLHRRISRYLEPICDRHSKQGISPVPT